MKGTKWMFDVVWKEWMWLSSTRRVKGQVRPGLGIRRRTVCLSALGRKDLLALVPASALQ